jgi:hypothetical protein
MNKKEQWALRQKAVWRHKVGFKYNDKITRHAIALHNAKEDRPADPVKACTISVNWQNKAASALYKTLATPEEKLKVKQRLLEEKQKKEAERQRLLHPTVEQQQMFVTFPLSSVIFSNLIPSLSSNACSIRAPIYSFLTNIYQFAGLKAVIIVCYKCTSLEPLAGY